MPRFIPNGPVIPERLVQELEDDRVVIFCGAGISMGSGLPSYSELVRHCYEELGQSTPKKTDTEWLWPDRMLGALESKTTLRDVRRVTAMRLSEEPTNLDLHKALLRLARLRRTSGLRLVTTNFDLLFEKAQENLRLGYDYHSGPILPIPRNDRAASWRSIVYLHGRLAAPEGDNSHLVLTSADFGRAYLTDAWAARFVSRLFSDFTVLFVGYSLNDPVLRYMTDAFAAEDVQARGGKSRGPAYLFVPHGRTRPDPQPYRDRKLEPIFYHQTHRHVRLKKTLIEWARAREDYLSNVRVIISRIARNPPESLDPSATDSVLWAVLGRPEDRGHGAKIFANLDPLPGLQWLDAFERREAELQKTHAAEVAAAKEAERAVPAEPAYHVGQLFPSIHGDNSYRLTDASEALIHWLIRHLESTELVEWTITKLQDQRRPHAQLRYHIRRGLAQTTLSEGFGRFWRIVSSEGGWALGPAGVLYPLWGFEKSLRAERDAPWVRQELFGALRPYLAFDRSFFSKWETAQVPGEIANPRGTRLAEIADAEVILTNEDYLPSLIEAIDRTDAPDAFWAAQLDILTELLRQVFELFAVAGEANREADPSAFHRPSIVPHVQNRHHNVWTRLFDLIWRGWSHLDAIDPRASRHQIETWQRIPFLGFQRLALAAIQHSPHFSPDEKLEALLDG